MWKSNIFDRLNYQTEHFFTGFITLPAGQFQVSENSCKLLKGPRTRKRFKEWTSVSTLFLILACRLTLQNVCAKLRKKVSKLRNPRTPQGYREIFKALESSACKHWKLVWRLHHRRCLPLVSNFRRDKICRFRKTVRPQELDNRCNAPQNIELSLRKRFSRLQTTLRKLT